MHGGRAEYIPYNLRTLVHVRRGRAIYSSYYEHYIVGIHVSCCNQITNGTMSNVILQCICNFKQMLFILPAAVWQLASFAAVTTVAVVDTTGRWDPPPVALNIISIIYA